MIHLTWSCIKSVVNKRTVPLEQEGPVYPGAQLHDPGAVQDPPFSHVGEHMALSNKYIPTNYMKQNYLIVYT